MKDDLTSRILKTFVALPAILFIVIGLRWLVDPAGVAPELGLSLLSGIGLSSQIGDMSGYFLAMGACILTALVTRNCTWFYFPVVLLLLTAVGRVIAWLVHDAAFAGRLIAVEVIVAGLLVFAAWRLRDDA